MNGLADTPEIFIFFYEYKTFIELLPIFIYGAFAGLASYLNGSDENKNIGKVFKVAMFNSVLCAAIYGLSRELGLSYLAAISLGAFISLMGLDKTLDIGDKVLSLIRSTKKDKE